MFQGDFGVMQHEFIQTGIVGQKRARILCHEGYLPTRPEPTKSKRSSNKTPEERLYLRGWLVDARPRKVVPFTPDFIKELQAKKEAALLANSKSTEELRLILFCCLLS